jgi:hypothetical protein
MLVKLFVVFSLLILTSCATVQENTATPAQQNSNPGQVSGQSVPLGVKKSGDISVHLFSDPASPVRGNNTLKVHLEGSNGHPITDAKISFDLDMTNMSHGKNVVPATSLGAGDYQGKVNFMMPGPWRVIVGIEQSGQMSTVRFDFNVKTR